MKNCDNEVEEGGEGKGGGGVTGVSESRSFMRRREGKKSSSDDLMT